MQITDTDGVPYVPYDQLRTTLDANADLRAALEKIRHALNGPYPANGVAEIVEAAEKAGAALQAIGRATGEDWDYYEDLPPIVSKLAAAEAKLARYEELHQAVVALDLKLCYKRKPEDYMHTFRSCDKVNAVVIALTAIEGGEVKP